MLSRARGGKAILVVVLTTALVITPLVLLGVYLGYCVGDAAGYSKSVLAIAFSTTGFLAGMAILLRVIRSVVAWTDGPRN
jgi:F0F1-type ATP synthase assembly protein I